VCIGALLVALWGASSPVLAYLKIGVLTSTGVKAVRWTRPIQYLVTNRDTAFVSATQLRGPLPVRSSSSW
jgi:hypothetical protein